MSKDEAPATRKQTLREALEATIADYNKSRWRAECTECVGTGCSQTEAPCSACGGSGNVPGSEWRDTPEAAMADHLATRLEALQAQPVGEEAPQGETLDQYGDRIVAKTRKLMMDRLPDDVIGDIRDSHLVFGKACAQVAVTTAMDEMAGSLAAEKAAALTASPPVVDDLSPATRRMEQILDVPFVRKVETLQAFERLQAMMPADRARDGMTTIAVRGEDMRALLDAILDRPVASAPPVVEREAIALALLNESRRFSGLPLIDSLNGLQPHQYRDQLRYADAILALTPVEGVGEDVPAGVMDALAKIMPIRVQDGPDYAEVFFSDGIAHSTQAMTMNPQDWRDLDAAVMAALSTPVAQGDEPSITRRMMAAHASEAAERGEPYNERNGG